MTIVAQPKSRNLAMAVATAIHVAHQNGELSDLESHEAMNAMLQLQPYTVAGFASPDFKRVLDADGKYLRPVVAGDSFVRENTES